MSSTRLIEELDKLDAKLLELLAHPETIQADKASLVLAGVYLAEIRRNHMPRWTPVNPATLPPRSPGQPYPQLPKGWAVEWENSQEVGHG